MFKIIVYTYCIVIGIVLIVLGWSEGYELMNYLVASFLLIFLVILFYTYGVKSGISKIIEAVSKVSRFRLIYMSIVILVLLISGVWNGALFVLVATVFWEM
jgi:hypothetical protein